MSNEHESKFNDMNKHIKEHGIDSLVHSAIPKTTEKAEAYVPKECWVEVPMSERLPEREQEDGNKHLSIDVFCINQLGKIEACIYNFDKKYWTDLKGCSFFPTHWLERQPLPSEPVGYSREDISKIVTLVIQCCRSDKELLVSEIYHEVDTFLSSLQPINNNSKVEQC